MNLDLGGSPFQKIARLNFAAVEGCPSPRLALPVCFFALFKNLPVLGQIDLSKPLKPRLDRWVRLLVGHVPGFATAT